MIVQYGLCYEVRSKLSRPSAGVLSEYLIKVTRWDELLHQGHEYVTGLVLAIHLPLAGSALEVKTLKFMVQHNEFIEVPASRLPLYLGWPTVYPALALEIGGV